MASTFEKHYIGKGTQVKDLDIIKVVIPMPIDEKAIFEKEGKQYLSFEVSRMKEPDKFGRTHTCYFQTREAGEPSDTDSNIDESNAEEDPAPEPEDDLPF
jgi:Ran GTPase-activating protein (RanGAP) involved in mRNA processing and transport